MPKATGSRAASAQNTRAAIIKAARVLFGKSGFHATSTPEIVNMAGVSRGALQHHFPRKEDLFLAVFNDIQQDLLTKAELSSAVPSKCGETWSTFLGNLDAFLKGVSNSEIQKILIIDGPAVLGWCRWRELEAHYGLQSIVTAIEDGIASGQIREQSSKPLAHMILALIHEAGLQIANGDGVDDVYDQAITALKHLLTSLK